MDSPAVEAFDDQFRASQDLAAQVGRRIRRLRTERNMSLSRLASLSGLGKGTLSELERGQRNPTLDTLFAVTTVLRAPLGALLVDEIEHGDPLDAAPATGESVRARLLHNFEDDQGVLETYLLEITPHEQHSSPHQAGVRETITVLRGAVRAGSRANPVLVEAGETYRYSGDEEHVFAAESAAATAILIMDYPQGNAD